MNRFLLLGLMLSSVAVASRSSEVHLDRTKAQIAAQRARGCVNSIPGICVVPIHALFSPYAERLYGEKVDVVGYLRLMGKIWVLYPDKDSAQHAIAERGIYITFDDKIQFDEKYMSKRYVQVRGHLRPSSEAIFWAEIVLTDPPQEAPFYVDGPVEPAPPKPDNLPE